MILPLEEQQRQFDGFDPITANFLYCPNQFIDVCIAQCNNRGVVRIVAYVIRQQLGWVDEHGNPIHKDVTISRKDIIEKAGVSNGAAGDALELAVALGFLICTQDPRPHAQQQAAQSGAYELRWDRSGNYVSDLESFQGFHAGSHFTPVPNQFFDVIIRNDPLSDVKVVGAIIRHTIGYTTKFGQRKQRAALSQLDLAQYTNLSTGKVINGAIQSILRKGYIQCVKQGVFDSRGREFGNATEYAMKWRQEAISTASSPKSPAKESGVDLSKKPSENAPKSPAKKRSKKPSNRNTSSNNNKQRQVVAVEFQEAFDLLMQVEFDGDRFDEKTCLKLAESRGLDEIKQQIKWLPYRKADRNPLGMLRLAIEQGWSAPIEITERKRNRDAAHKEREAADAESAEVAETDRVKKAIRRHRKDVLPLWDELTDEERDGIEQSASEQLNSDFHREQFQTNDDFHLEKCLDELCRQKGTIPTTSLVT